MKGSFFLFFAASILIGALLSGYTTVLAYERIPVLSHDAILATTLPPFVWPDILKKQEPTTTAFTVGGKKCDPWGVDEEKWANLAKTDATKLAKNRRQDILKNRTDQSTYKYTYKDPQDKTVVTNYVPVPFGEILKLEKLKDLKLAWRRDRGNWPLDVATTIAKYEGIPIMVEGYLAGVKPGGAEATNCTDEHVSSTILKSVSDWHVWLIGKPPSAEGRTKAMVVETTPRVRASHPNWDINSIQLITIQKIPVRISGWLFFDPEHPDDLNKSRGTLWEIHPVMKIEVQPTEGGDFVNLDNCQFVKGKAKTKTSPATSDALSCTQKP